MLPKEAIEEFKTLYLQEFGIELTNEKALELGLKLIRMIKVVYGHDLPKENEI
jgi:hypothetical protein